VPGRQLLCRGWLLQGARLRVWVIFLIENITRLRSSVCDGIELDVVQLPSTPRPTRVVGIDPGPAKGLHCFEASGWNHVGLDGSRSYLHDLAQEKSVLVCWDAPLTGPSREGLLPGSKPKKKDFTQRPIDAFFGQNEWNFKAPKGISVLPYSGCSHWTISRSLLGLPKVGPYDQAMDLPFQLCHGNSIPGPGVHIVEVHPALALWLWCKNDQSIENWQYKKDIELCRRLLKYLSDRVQDDSTCHAFSLAEAAIKDPGKGFDDIFDSCIAYVLGDLWIRNSGDVILLGNLDTGAMLLPNVDGIRDKWEEFLIAASKKPQAVAQG
jgi:hypothetical protein